MLPLRNIYLHVTLACQSRCAHCYASAGTPLPDELSAGEIARFWADAVAVHPERLIVTGGEPLLRPDLFDLLQSLRDADPRRTMRRCLNTNGRLVTRDVAARLADLVDEVRVSVDGTADVHDSLRGEGSFELALRALAHLRAAGVAMRAVITASKSGLAGLDHLLLFLRDRGVATIQVNPLKRVGRGAEHAAEVVDPATLRAAHERAWHRLFPQAAPTQPSQAAPASTNCGIGKYLNVMPDGDIYPCHVLMRPELRLGNVRADRLADICAPDGPLARLRALDFGALAKQDPRLGALARPGVCLGEVPAACDAIGLGLMT